MAQSVVEPMSNSIRRLRSGEEFFCIYFPKCRARATWLVDGTSYCFVHVFEGIRLSYATANRESIDRRESE